MNSFQQEHLNMIITWISKAEQRRSGLFPRDGALIKPVPASIKMTNDEMKTYLLASLVKKPFVQPDLILQHEHRDRSLLFFFRSLAYLSQNAEQSLRDALACIAYLPNSPSVKTLCPLAHDLASSACENGRNIPEAILHLILSKEAGAMNGSSYEILAHLDLQLTRLSPCVEDKIKEGLLRLTSSVHSCSSKELEQVLHAIAEEELPLFKRERKPFYYYEQMMKRKILALIPTVDDGDEAIVSKMVKATDADDLLVLLEHPRFLLDRVDKMREVMRIEGAEAMLALPPPPRLTYDQVAEMRAKEQLLLVDHEGGQDRLNQEHKMISMDHS